jgi:flagellar motor switch protein FliN/FliY
MSPESPQRKQPEAPAAGAPPEGAPPAVEAHVPDFAELTPGGATTAPGSLDSLLDVTVTVTAELGRVTLPISEVLRLGLGSVLELNRSVSEPVDLMVQGVRLARGEVVVVDDRFAIRIQEIIDPKKRVPPS